jgi:hypothetical protein
MKPKHKKQRPAPPPPDNPAIDAERAILWTKFENIEYAMQTCLPEDHPWRMKIMAVIATERESNGEDLPPPDIDKLRDLDAEWCKLRQEEQARLFNGWTDCNGRWPSHKENNSPSAGGMQRVLRLNVSERHKQAIGYMDFESCDGYFEVAIVISQGTKKDDVLRQIDQMRTALGKRWTTYTHLSCQPQVYSVSLDELGTTVDLTKAKSR